MALIPVQFENPNCPSSIRYSKVHGPNAATATVIYMSQDVVDPITQRKISTVPVPLNGTKVAITCDQSKFHGYVTKTEVSTSDETGLTTTVITAVDWRDRLSDIWIFGAFNVREENGVYWHLFPHLWEEQRRTYISRPLNQVDFNAIQNVNVNIPWGETQIQSVGRLSMISMMSILHILEKAGKFSCSYSLAVKLKMESTYPINMNWESGAQLANALEELLSYASLQWTVDGADQVRITRRGEPTDFPVRDYLNNVSDMCDLDAYTASRGKELTTEGRSVILIGGRNRRQFLMPCNPDWNQRFDATVCFNGVVQHMLLSQYNLQPFSKMKELPKEWQDDEYWDSSPERIGAGAIKDSRTRNEMGIYDYIREHCFRTYVVNTGCAVITTDESHPMEFAVEDEPFTNEIVTEEVLVSGLSSIEAKYLLLDKHALVYDRRKTPLSISAYPFLLHHSDMVPFDFEDQELNEAFWVPEPRAFWPLSQELVTESNVKAMVFSTKKHLVLGREFPIELQHLFTPTTEGFEIEPEEIINKDTGNAEYLIRVKFNEPQTYLRNLAKWEDHTQYEPDKILVAISFDHMIYSYSKGNTLSVRSRPKRQQIENVFKAFVDDVEVLVLAEHIQHEWNSSGVKPATHPVHADYIANKLADQLLLNNATTNAGSAEFKDEAYHDCDGLIENVSVSFTDEGGLTELITFTKHLAPSSKYLPPTIYRRSTALKTDAVLQRERLEEFARKAAVKMSPTTSGYSFDEVSSDARAAAMSATLRKLFGDDGLRNQDTANAAIDLFDVEDEEGNPREIKPCDVIILEGPEGEEEE